MPIKKIPTKEMFRFDQEKLDSYLKQDKILGLLKKTQTKTDKDFITHQWLLEIPPKRLIHNELYSKLLTKNSRLLKILDVGGGYSSITKQMAKKCDYTLLDIMSHDEQKKFKKISLKEKINWLKKDWFNFNLEENGPYDLIIANDIFPNVDQRLDKFLKKYLPFCKVLKMSITCHNIPTFYEVYRKDSKETLFIKAWDGKQTKSILSKYSKYIIGKDFTILNYKKDSIFKNQRQVFNINFKGYLN